MSKICPKCGNTHSKNGKYCSRSCANSRVITLEHKTKTSATMLAKPIKNQFGEFMPRHLRTDLHEVVGQYTKLFLNTCAKTGIKFYYTSYRKYHPSIINDKNDYNRNCSFRFSISDFPLWFEYASNLIREYGWYSTPGSNKDGVSNVNGCSRDHLLSVNEGYLQNIDPYYISHPANCQIVTHTTNQKKGKYSSISFEELKSLISDFELLYPGYGGGTRTPVV